MKHLLIFSGHRCPLLGRTPSELVLQAGTYLQRCDARAQLQKTEVKNR